MTTNRYSAPCRRCHKIVAPGEGFTTGKPGDWQTIHDKCVPVADHAHYQTERV
jgi:hypothetical protein